MNVTNYIRINYIMLLYFWTLAYWRMCFEFWNQEHLLISLNIFAAELFEGKNKHLKEVYEVKK